MGYLSLALAGILWAFGGAYASRLIDDGASFVELTEARSWITFLVLLAVLVARREPVGRQTQVRFAWILLFGLSIATANLSYYWALSRLPVAIAITLQYTAPAIVVLLAVFFEDYRPTRRIIASIAGAVIGVALLAELPSLVGSGGFELDAAGLLIAGVSALAFATYIVAGARVGKLGAQQSVFRGFAVASVVWIVVQLVRGRPDTLLDTRFLPGILFLALGTTVAPFLLFLWGLQSVPPAQAAIVATLEPLAAAVLAWVFLDQRLSWMQIVGAALVVVGVAVVQVEREPTQDELAERAAIE